MIVLTAETNRLKPEIQETWISGPSILVTFYTDDQSITRVTLKEASQFSCAIHGENLTILEWLEGYLQGKSLPLPLNFSSLSPFTRKGLETIRSIPFGKVKSYGQVAKLMECEKGARAIGNVCNKNPFPLVIPCHRVIQGNGTLGGFAYPLPMKELLLEFETHTHTNYKK